MPADKGGLWVEDKLSGFNPGKTDTLFSLSPPGRGSWIGRAVQPLSTLRTAASLSSRRPGADETTATDLRIWHFYHTNTLSTRGCIFLKSCDLSHILLVSIRNGLFYYYDTFKCQKLILEEAKGNNCSLFVTACSLTSVRTSLKSNFIQITFEYLSESTYLSFAHRYTDNEIASIFIHIVRGHWLNAAI